MGSTFWVELPLTETSQRSEAASANAIPQKTKKYTILYIEDNRVNIQLVREILNERDDVQLLTAVNGVSGIELARKSQPQLILLDLHLPGLSGEEVFYRLQADPLTRPIPVVVITADTTPHLDERLRGAGITEFVPKPLDISHFLKVVSQILR
jgi:CheY-like chemotaxis protein